MVVVIVIIAIVFVCVISNHIHKSSSGQSSGSYSNSDETMHYVKKAPGDTGFDSIGYSGNVRYIDGVPIKTTADFDRWRVINGHAMSMCDHLRSLQYQFTSKTDTHSTEHYEEWKQYYQKYRELIVRHRLWNMCIGEHEPFIQSEAQLAEEKRFLSDLDKQYNEALIDQESYIDELYHKNLLEQEIIKYLQSCPRKNANKTEMIKKLAGGDSDKRKALQRAYTSLLRKNIIGEKKDDNGQIIARFIVRRKKTETDTNSIPELPASTYHPEQYKDLWKQIINKAELTVGIPEKVDRQKNTCQFKSLTNGSIYYTSLEQCTCPAFGGKEPCKHMVKLAMYLGYYKNN